eukprot:TRINITY_DN65419_c8_g5_i1.p1 TRINITY_DN65419_c8_g5~~TRINITY_DN65419_c8_g5_i1.p1  ORF type:complete len:166 (-),score=48.32 TRINITY_DN65419_c8_g5_i1:134-631(-)
MSAKKQDSMIVDETETKQDNDDVPDPFVLDEATCPNLTDRGFVDREIWEFVQQHKDSDDKEMRQHAEDMYDFLTWLNDPRAKKRELNFIPDYLWNVMWEDFNEIRGPWPYKMTLRHIVSLCFTCDPTRGSKPIGWLDDWRRRMSALKQLKEDNVGSLLLELSLFT